MKNVGSSQARGRASTALALLAGAAVLLAVSPAWAAGAGTAMPWEGPLDFATRVAREHTLPFNPLIPNEETVEAMKEARRGNLETVTLDQLQAVLDADD